MCSLDHTVVLVAGCSAAPIFFSNSGADFRPGVFVQGGGRSAESAVCATLLGRITGSLRPMFQPIELFIGLRHTRAKRRNHFQRPQKESSPARCARSVGNAQQPIDPLDIR